jgi:hypothetical protein
MRLYEILTEGVAGPKSCWPDHRKVGTQPGTGKNKGKRVNDCEKIKKEDVKEASLGNVLSWPEVVNKVSSAMKATGWKGKRMNDDAFMFTTRGAEVEDQWYIAIIDNAGDGFFTYALGTVEEGDPHIDDAFKGKLPNTEASVSELMDEIRDGFGLGESTEDLHQEFDMIENIIEYIADQHAIDAELVWEDLSVLSDDELYVFAATSNPINEDWQKVNKKDKTDGMSKKAVNAYRRENPGSKLKTAVTTKPSKLKRGSKASKRRSSYCSRSAGQKKMHNIDCSKTPDKAICKARRRWNC